ncbi:MAG: hypothetical protein ACK4MD_05645 [Demequina sp.]
MPVRSAAFSGLLEADEALRQCQRAYDSLASTWTLWGERRESLAQQLVALRPGVAVPSNVAAPLNVAAPSATATAPSGAPSAAESASAESAPAEPTPRPAAASAPGFFAPEPARPAALGAQGAPSPVSAAAPASAPQPQPTQPPTQATRAPRVLTAPALLGVSGASLMIAAAVVFVAIAWTTFTPLARGLAVLGMSVAVAALSAWLRRMHLPITSGAVGIVSMGFAGAAGIAFLRDTPASGPFDLPLSLVIACGAGLLLTRWRIRWVGSAAALALAAAGAGLTIAATTQAADASAGLSGIWAWALTGTAVACALLLTQRWWTWRLARAIIRWGGLSWAVVIGASVPLWAWATGGSVLEAVVGLVPLAALIGMARWWPRVAIPAAAVVATLLAPALASAAGATPWQQVTTVAAVGAAGALTGLRLGDVAATALLYGLVPAYAGVALATVGHAAVAVVARTVGNPAVVDIDLWAGAAGVVAGASLALLRSWRLAPQSSVPELYAGATVVGSLMVASGAGLIASGIAELAPRDSIHAAVAVALTAAGVALTAARHLWTRPVPRGISSWSGIVLLVVAGGHGVWGLQMVELPLGWSLAAAVLPVAGLALHGLRRPWEGSLPATVFLTAVVAALVIALDASVAAAMAAAVAFAAAVAWLLRRLPSAQQRPVAAGLVPAVAWGGVCGLWTVVATVAWVASADAVPDRWVAATACAAAIALASSRTGPARAAASWAEPWGAALLIAAVPGGLAALADGVNLEPAWATAGVGIASALVIAALLPLWRQRLARRLTRVGSVALVTLAGVAAVLRLADARGDLAPALTLSLVALVLLALASRWWPRAALAPAAFLATMIAPAAAVRGGLGDTAAVALMALVAAAVLTVMLRLPLRWRATGAVGALPATFAAAAATLVVVLTAVAATFSGDLHDVALASPWWALALTVGLAATADRWRRFDAGAPQTRIASVTGAVALVLTVVVATPWLPSLTGTATGVALVLMPLVATALGAALVAWTLGWQDELAAATARRGSIAWAVIATFALQQHVSTETAPWPGGVAAVAGVALALVWAARRWPLEALPPAVALVTLVPLAVGAAVEAPLIAAACVAGVLVAVSAWAARRLAHTARRAVWIGAAPAAAVVGIAVLAAVALAAAALAAHVRGDLPLGVPSGWHVGAVVAASVTALAWRDVAWFRGWLPLGVLAVASAALLPVWAAALLGLAGPALLWWGRRLGAGGAAASAASGLALLWAVGSDVALAGTAVGATVVALAIAQGWRTAAQPWGAVVAPITAAIAGTFGARAIGVPTIDAPVAMGLAMATVLVLVSGRSARLRDNVAATALAITVVVPMVAASVQMAGVTLLLAAAAWWRLRSAGLAWAQWMCAAAASLGTGLIVAGADIQVIEAYTAVPAASLLLIGAQWMRDKPQMRSLTALAPGLTVALIPSYLALVLEPNALARTVALVAATIVLALAGVRLRWFAPILGTAVTAVVVSVLQIVVGANLLVRLVAFAVVGSLLLAISSWFERLKELR